MVTDDRSRGQIILIGAIALAFIILGVVVVFNGVLYTETLSSGSSSQSASTADVTTTEVEQSVGCLLVVLQDDVDENDSDTRESVAKEIEALSSSYQNTGAKSTPAVRSIEVDDYDDDVEITEDPATNNAEIDDVTVIVTYVSHDLSTKQRQEIKPDNCPDEEDL